MSHLLKYQPKKDGNTNSFILATFSENFPPASLFEGEEFAENPSNFALFGQKEKRILKIENDKFEYIGKNFGENSERNQENRYLIGIASKSKKRMKLYDVDHIFNMKQIKKIKTEEENENILPKEQKTNKMNPLEMKQMLVAEFGTKKSKKKLQQMLNNVVEVMYIHFQINYFKIRKKISPLLLIFKTCSLKKQLI